MCRNPLYEYHVNKFVKTKKIPMYRLYILRKGDYALFTENYRSGDMVTESLSGPCEQFRVQRLWAGISKTKSM